MGKTIYSDNTDINGVNYATVGENIREGAKKLTYESIDPVLKNNKKKALTALNASAYELVNVILYLFTGQSPYHTWGETTIGHFTEEQKQQIKTYLGIS